MGGLHKALQRPFDPYYYAPLNLMGEGGAKKMSASTFQSPKSIKGGREFSFNMCYGKEKNFRIFHLSASRVQRSCMTALSAPKRVGLLSGKA
jgi:hypothetical protein